MKKFILPLLLLLTQLSLADWYSVESSNFSMQDPPVEGSAAYKHDFEELLTLQQSRTQADCDLGASQEIPGFATLFEAGPIPKSEYSKYTELFERALKLTGRISTYFKNKYERPRPFNVDARIKPCIEKPKGAKAYPSSHSSMAKTGACLLKKVLPKYSAAITSYGDHVGQLRAIVGVHHPSDIVAGQRLGQDICDYLLKDADFKAELEELR